MIQTGRKVSRVRRTFIATLVHVHIIYIDRFNSLMVPELHESEQRFHMHWNKAVANRLRLDLVARMHNCFEVDHVTRKKISYIGVLLKNHKSTSKSD